MYNPLDPVVRQSRIVSSIAAVVAVEEFFYLELDIPIKTKKDIELRDRMRKDVVEFLEWYFTIRTQTYMSYQELLESNPIQKDDGVVYGVAYTHVSDDEIIGLLLSEVSKKGSALPELTDDKIDTLYSLIETSAEPFLSIVEDIVLSSPASLHDVKFLTPHLCSINRYDDIRALRYSNARAIDAQIKELED